MRRNKEIDVREGIIKESVADLLKFKNFVENMQESYTDRFIPVGEIIMKVKNDPDLTNVTKMLGDQMGLRVDALFDIIGMNKKEKALLPDLIGKLSQLVAFIYLNKDEEFNKDFNEATSAVENEKISKKNDGINLTKEENALFGKLMKNEQARELTVELAIINNLFGIVIENVMEELIALNTLKAQSKTNPYH
ncbi:MAG: hypothetical protein QXI89_02055 [Candidatus Anstonellales archaeon]